MLYALHEASYYATTPMRLAARMTRDFWGSPVHFAGQTKVGRSLYAAADLFTNVTRRYGKTDWDIDTRFQDEATGRKTYALLSSDGSRGRGMPDEAVDRREGVANDEGEGAQRRVSSCRCRRPT